MTNTVETRRNAYTETRLHHRHTRQKLSRFMAMVFGGVITAEIIIIAAMILKIDLHSADRIALAFGSVVLYSGVVVMLTDK